VIGGKDTRFQVIGLSATPLPTNTESRWLLENYVFPLPLDESRTVARDWGVHVIERIENASLERRGILCPVNSVFQTRGTFDIPTKLLEEVMDDQDVEPPPREGRPDKLLTYASQFNARVMEDERILDHLARVIGDNLCLLGKTLVFVSTINAANMLTQLLGKRIKKNNVSMVHSRLDEMDWSKTDSRSRRDLASPYKHIAEFKKRGDEPCVMVNVGMLTTGFDDPKIQTVVLARLTFSTNLFWQMIGRGTRGPLAKGTSECIVIDPIRLTELYEYTRGYRPSLEQTEYFDSEHKGRLGIGEGALHPSVSTLDQAPTSALTGLDKKARDQLLENFAASPEAPQDVPYDTEQLREILERFLAGEITSNEEQIALTLETHADLEDTADGLLTTMQVRSPDEPRQAHIPEVRIRRLEEILSAPLDFLRNLKPEILDSAATTRWFAQIDLVERQQIRSREEFDAEITRRLYG